MLVLAGCAADAHPDLDERALPKIRPTSGDSTVNAGYGDEAAQRLVSASGQHAVWYVTSGQHRVPARDLDPADGVPDFVQRVAETADGVRARLDAAGWRAPVTDAFPGGPRDNGGGPEFDIYLVEFARADGLFFTESCSDDQPPLCSGYIAMENDFARSGYATVEEGVRVLVSHEYFHAVQAAYSGEIPGWLSEGTATWHEERFDPTQSDFERLASVFFEHGGRSLNGPPGGAFDGFAYGTAVWPLFLELQFGEDVLLDVFESIAAGASAEEAFLATVPDFDVAFATFSAWTLLTGERARDGVGFPMARDFPELDLTELDGTSDLNWDASVRPWASAGAAITRPRPLEVGIRAVDGWERTPLLAVVDLAGVPAIDVLGAGESATWPASPAALLVAMANPDPYEQAAGRVTIRAGEAPEPDEGPPAPDPAPASGEDAGCALGAPAPLSLAFGPLLALVVRRRRLQGARRSRTQSDPARR